MLAPLLLLGAAARGYWLSRRAVSPVYAIAQNAIADREIPVMADRRTLGRLFGLLLDNAVKYTSPPGVVELLLELRDYNSVITVRDSGIGISEQHQSNGGSSARFKVPSI
jgi:signal transduction histidine kinase